MKKTRIFIVFFFAVTAVVIGLVLADKKTENIKTELIGNWLSEDKEVHFEFLPDGTVRVGTETKGTYRVLNSDTIEISAFDQEKGTAKIRIKGKTLVLSSPDGGFTKNLRKVDKVSEVERANVTRVLKISLIKASETVAFHGLKNIFRAQKDFFRHDSDGDGENNYWTKDIYGFYGTKDRNGNQIKYIPSRFAHADKESKSVPKPIPKDGYFYISIKFDELGRPYSEKRKSKWAACAYPSEHGKVALRTFVTNESGRIYAKDIKGAPVETWIGKNPQKDGWSLIKNMPVSK